MSDWGIRRGYVNECVRAWPWHRGVGCGLIFGIGCRVRVELKVESGLGASLGSLIMPYGPKAGDHFGDHELWMGAKKYRRRLRAV